MKNAKVYLYEKVSCLYKIWDTTQNDLFSGLKSCWHKIVFHVRTSLGSSCRLDSGTCLPSSYVMIQTHCYFLTARNYCEKWFFSGSSALPFNTFLWLTDKSCGLYGTPSHSKPSLGEVLPEIPLTQATLTTYK